MLTPYYVHNNINANLTHWFGLENIRLFFPPSVESKYKMSIAKSEWGLDIRVNIHETIVLHFW